MTNREHEFLDCGIEYAEGIERAKVINLPSGREIRKTTGEFGEDMWMTQPWNKTHWLYFGDLLDAVKCATRPETIRPIVYDGRPQRNPPAVEIRKPFTVEVVFDPAVNDDRWGVLCQGKPTFPNTHGVTLLVTLLTKPEAQALADTLNQAFANHFDN